MAWVIIDRPGVKLYKPYYSTAKRILDVTLCLLTAPLVIPLVLIIAILIRLESPGPILFVQERIGKGKRSFKIIKFRTMYHDIEQGTHKVFMKAFVKGNMTITNGKKTFKPFHDKQVTNIGRVLRRTSLDELPQLINVFRGDMSLVGPRPNVVWEVEEYQGWHQERLEVLPGITGLAQVRGRSGISFDEIVKYDIEYLEKRNMWLDLKILWWTVVSVTCGKGAH
jgi:lipopolysaccharide/colanic/teichoic acid biosynthesis glycosyltransferase